MACSTTSSSCSNQTWLSNKKALVILTSVNTLRSSSSPSEKRPTGCNIKELAYLNEKLFKPHPQVNWTLCTPAGSEAPLDPTSERERERDSVVEQFMRDEKIKQMLKQTEKLSSINPSEYSAVFFMGGAGAMLDFPEHEESISNIVETIYHQNKGIVASIGHGLAALAGLRVPSSSSEEEEERQEERSNEGRPKGKGSEEGKPKGKGSQEDPNQENPKGKSSSNPFISNRKVTGMTSEEEKDLGLEDFVPFSLEQRCRENGAHFEKKPKFTSNAICDERLVTAQNQESSAEWIQQICELCRKMHEHQH